MRNTKTKKGILLLLGKEQSPLSAPELLKSLKNSVNKTTIYRILGSLISNGIIRELDFGEGKKRYEINTNHHHHLICQNCRKIEHVEVKEVEPSLKLAQKELSVKNNFKIIDHTLDFFGLCSSCQI